MFSVENGFAMQHSLWGDSDSKGNFISGTRFPTEWLLTSEDKNAQKKTYPTTDFLVFCPQKEAILIVRHSVRRESSTSLALELAGSSGGCSV